jgi:hypothetical protein
MFLKERLTGAGKLDRFHVTRKSCGPHITFIGRYSALRLGGITDNTSEFSFTFFRYLICGYNILVSNLNRLRWLADISLVRLFDQ